MIVLKIVHSKGNKKALRGTFFLESSTNDSTRLKMRQSFGLEERKVEKLKFLN